MSEDRMPRIDGDGPSALERLRQLVREQPEEGDFLAEQKRKLPAKKVVAMIASRHGIRGLDSKRLSDFWRWLDSRRAIRQMNADAAQFREDLARDGVPLSAEEIHIRTVDYMRLKGVREDNDKLLAYAVTEARKAIELEHGARKLALLESKAEEAATAASDSKLSDAEKAARVREIFRK